MSRTTGIEWTDVTWNPIRGCSRVSEGCRHCYAERNANRFMKPGAPFHGLIQIGEDGKGHCASDGMMYRVGKKAAGRLLDGREWNEMPAVRHAG